MCEKFPSSDTVQTEKNKEMSDLQDATLRIHDAGMETAKTIIELAKNAESLWKQRTAKEKVEFLKLILSNPRLHKFGGGCAKLQELSGPTISKAYELSWEREYLDLTELARLRWVEGWKIQKLADYFETSPTAIKERLRAIKANPGRIKIPLD